MNTPIHFITIVEGKKLKVPHNDDKVIAIFGYIEKFIVAKSNGLKDERGIIKSEPKWLIFNGKNLSIDAKSRSIVVFDGVVDLISVLTREGEVYQVFDVDDYGVISIIEKNKVIKEYVVDDKGRLKKKEKH